MNHMTASEGQTSWLNQRPGTQHRLCNTLVDINQPSPSLAWVLIDEHADPINDGFFWVSMFATTALEDIPASYHGESSALSFADGHAKIKLWRAPSILELPVTKTGYGHGSAAGGVDLLLGRRNTPPPSNSRLLRSSGPCAACSRLRLFMNSWAARKDDSSDGTRFPLIPQNR